MLLAIDVGNTNIVLGVFDGADAGPELAAADAARADVRRARPAGRRPVRAQPDRARRRSAASILGSVVPPLTGTMRDDGRSATSASTPLIVEPGVNTGHADPLREPGRSRRRSHRQRASPRTSSSARSAARPLIVVDFGTATTFDAVTREGRVSGRRDLSGRADFGRRAVSARRAAAAHRRAQAGARRSAGRRSARWSRACSTATSGMVEGLVRRMSDELGGNALCVATGGLADVDRAGDVAHRARRRRPDAARPADRVGTEPVRDDAICDRRLLPGDRNLPLPEERRPPDPRRRPVVRSRRRLGGAGRAAQGRVRAASIATSSATTARGRGGGRCGSTSARPTCSTCSTSGAGRSGVQRSRQSSGVSPPVADSRQSAESRRPSLPAHLERVVLRLTTRARQRHAGRRVRRADRSRRRASSTRRGPRPAACAARRGRR